VVLNSIGAVTANHPRLFGGPRQDDKTTVRQKPMIISGHCVRNQTGIISIKQKWLKFQITRAMCDAAVSSRHVFRKKYQQGF